MTKQQATVLVFAELTRAQAAHPAFHSTHEGVGVLEEEMRELWDAIRRNDRTHASYEAVQVAAMALRFLLDCGVFDDVAHYTDGLRTAKTSRRE